jgi:CBS domain-containing protein
MHHMPTLKEIMTHSPVVMSPEKTVEDAAKLMKDHNSGAILVGTKENAAGIITDRDIAIRVVAAGKDPAKTLLKAVMSKPLHCCDIHASMEEVAELMRKCEVRRLVVLKDGHTNGVITLTSLVQNAGSQSLSDKVLHALLGTRRKRHESAAASAPADNDSEDFENFEGVF